MGENRSALAQAEEMSGGQIEAEERSAFLRARDEQPELVQNAFDSVELGRGAVVKLFSWIDGIAAFLYIELLPMRDVGPYIVAAYAKLSQIDFLCYNFACILRECQHDQGLDVIWRHPLWEHGAGLWFCALFVLPGELMDLPL